MNEFSRLKFDEMVLAVFPGGSWSKTRKEHTYGWTDTIDLNLLRIRICVYTKNQPRMKRGRVMVELHGNRSTLDSSTVLLWHEKTHWADLETTLINLRQILLGLAAAILQTTGKNNPKVEIPNPPWKDQFDTDDCPFSR